MCLVIDTCTFDSVFNTRSKHHEKYVPIVTWLSVGQGKIIFGGTKFKREIKGRAFLKMLAEFDRKGKLVKVSDRSVDKIARELKVKVPDHDFDDEHIMALVIITKCCVVCTDDKRATPFLKRRDLYPRGIKPPKIYRSKAHAPLCRNEHIVPACRDKDARR
jgi:hypothetical protein